DSDALREVRRRAVGRGHEPTGPASRAPARERCSRGEPVMFGERRGARGPRQAPPPHLEASSETLARSSGELALPTPGGVGAFAGGGLERPCLEEAQQSVRARPPIGPFPGHPSLEQAEYQPARIVKSSG